MKTRAVKPLQVIIVGSLILLLIFAFAWQSRLFGLGQQSETVFVPSASRTEDGVSYLDAGGATDDGSVTSASRQLEIVTILPFDGIPAIFNPQFVTAEQMRDQESARDAYLPDEKVLGIEINGDARAYSVPMLSRHEVVNDTVGGVPVAVTW